MAVLDLQCPWRRQLMSLTRVTDHCALHTVIGMMEQGGERMNSVMRKRPTIS